MSVGAVCAAEDISDDAINKDNPEILETTQTDIPTAGEASFANLAKEIENAGTVLDLNQDYAFNNETDKDFSIGIRIEKDNLVINGNNHIIDAKGQSRIFNVTGSNIIINNLILKNANDSAILDYGSLKTDNVTFTNCRSNEGGAVYVSKAEYVSVNDIFSDNSNSHKGAAIYTTSSDVTVYNVLFENNNMNWSSIYGVNSTLIIDQVTFANSTSRYATALYNEKSNVTIRNTRFVNLIANTTAGAIAFKDENNVTIQDCEFINVSSARNGGAIFTDIAAMKDNKKGYVIVNNTLFENCSSEFGGAYLQLGGSLEIINAEFINNFANYNGGAVYLSNVIDLAIVNTLFKNNAVNTTDDDYKTYGGALFVDDSNADFISNCLFTDNQAIKGGALYLYDSRYQIDKLEFNGNGNAIYTIFDKPNSKIGKLYGNDEITEDDFNNTYYPDMISGTGMKIIPINNATNITVIPARYDLRELNLVTPVKDQGEMGACWAFGMIGALESALLKAINYTADFSENNMQNSMLTYSIYGVNSTEEGSNIMSMAYLLSWLGAFPKNYDAYDELGKISPLITTEEDVHVQDIVAIRYTPGDIDSTNDVKEAILKYGALLGTILSKSTTDEGEPTDYYNKNTSAEYNPNLSSSNHEICVVGWDDNFSRDNFLITPPGDGAWIVKNSWGTDWGDGGYFYVSYYDQTFCSQPNLISRCFIAIPIENTIQYNKNYQYDISGISGDFYVDNGNQLAYSNNFVAYENDMIAAVGTYFNESGTPYGIEIYVNGELKLTQEGISEYYGYHTIKLDKYVPIRKGDNFTAKVISNKVPLCDDTRVYFEEGSSIVTFYNGDYEDISARGLAACLKVYTLEDDQHYTTLVTPSRTIGVNDAIYGYDYQFILRDENGTELANKEVQVSFNGKNQTVTTDENGWGTARIKADTEGSYDVEVTFEGDDDYYGISQSATIKLIKQKTSFVAPDRTVYVRDMSRGYKYSAILKDNYGKPLANKKVLFIFNGEKQVSYTDENGWATVTLKADTAGTQTVTIKFAGDRCYQETSTTRTIKIVREPSKLTVPEKSFNAANKNKKVTATLKSKSGNPIYGAKVTLTVNGKTYSATTNSIGAAVFNIDLTKLGIFDAVVKFAESRFYAATTTTSKIIIY